MKQESEDEADIEDVEKADEFEQKHNFRCLVRKMVLLM